MTAKEYYWNKDHWSKGIGFFLMRFAHIEEALCKIKISLDAARHSEKDTSTNLTNKTPKNWHGLKIEDRIAKLINQLTALPSEKYITTDKKSKAIDLLLRLESLIDTRNNITHGTFAIKDGSTPETPNYCIFSRTQKNNQNETVAKAKILHSSDLESQISESTHIEIGLSSCAQELMRTLALQTAPKYELIFASRAQEAMLSLSIGRFVIHMGEIENLTHLIYQKVLDPEYKEEYNYPTIKPSGHWDSLTLAKQVQDLLDRLPKTGEYRKLRESLLRLKETELINRRNLLCHAKVCHQISPISENLELVAVRQTRKGPEVITATSIADSISLASSLSDSLSEALAIASMSLTKPIKSRPME